MRRGIAVASILMLVSLYPASRSQAAIGDPISNVEQRVSGRGLRMGADQYNPDVSSTFMVWWDHRGTSTTPTGNSIWSKNLSSRGEAPVATLTTTLAAPRISGKWVVWSDRKPGSSNDDVFARKLPSGIVKRVTKDPAGQFNADIDGTKVVWEDKRNGDSDIYMKDLTTGVEKPVVVAPGNQTRPAITGNTIVWRDGRRGITAADVYAKIGTGTPFEVARSRGAAFALSGMHVAVSGNRILWNEADPAECGIDCSPKILKTKIVPAGTASVVDEIVGTDPDFSSVSDLDMSGTDATWIKNLGGVGSRVYTSDLASCDIPPCATPTQVDSSPNERVATPRIEGSRFAWMQVEDEGADIFWRDYSTGEGPIRANGLGLGKFADASSPAADGDVVAYGTNTRVGASEPHGGIWVTDLGSPRRHIAVAPELGTGYSNPAVAGTRVAWSDWSACSDPCDGDEDDTYERDPFDTGATTQLSSPDETGGPPDVDGSTTVWRCDPVALCVDDGTITSIDVSGLLLATSSAVGDRVRVSGDKVAWWEYWDGGGPDAALHVYDTTAATDKVIAQGVDKVGDVPDFDIAGTNVVWASQNTDQGSDIWTNTVTGDPPDATVLEDSVSAHILNQVSIDGTRAAWIDCPMSSTFSSDCDVATKMLSESESHVVTNAVRAEPRAPAVDGDRIYWVYAGDGFADVYMESISGAALPQPDAASPSAPTSFTATPAAGDILLAWTNPADTDLHALRIMRRAGTKPPSSMDDRKATMVYDDDGTGFTDLDVVAGKAYAYRIFAIDTEGNVTAGPTAKVVA